MEPGGLCVSLTPETLDDVFTADIAGADCVEVRLDYLKNPQQSIHTRWDRLPVPVIATCRGKERGGLFDGSIEEETRILDSAARNGARFVDIDYRYSRGFPPAQVIASYHNFDETPANLESLVEEACAANGDIAKVATQVRTWSDNRRLFEILSRPWPKPVIVVGMGDIGQITRIIGPARGSFLTYAASTRQAAPGQLSVSQMLDLYRFRRVSRSTKVLGILGMPVGHSLSPVLHNRAFEISQLDFVYVKLPAPEAKDFVDNARALGISGFSVTIPHKIAVMPYMQRLTTAATEVGAVNTVSDEQGSWVGDNTDVYGVGEALKSVGFNPAGKDVIILGRGGGAKAAIAAVKGARQIIVLAREKMVQANDRPCDLLVNATPVGMYPNVDAAPIAGSLTASIVFDMVYNPPITKLLESAARQGKTTVQGSRMLLAQAARQFEIWTGQPAAPEVYETELMFT
jgi:3-dehydroquinate dehydratase/shikimate dehydrogenase